jgi:hypothetical protein
MIRLRRSSHHSETAGLRQKVASRNAAKSFAHLRERSSVGGTVRPSACALGSSAYVNFPLCHLGRGIRPDSDRDLCRAL